MSVTMSKADGITVFTVTSDPDSQCPPICQILKSLCYSRVCCSVSPQFRKIQRTSLSVLGALQIMIGLLNIGLGIIIHQSYTGGWFLDETLHPYWLGVLVILFGIMCILSERYPSPCLVILNVTLNLTGIAFAITGIVLYSICVPMSYRYWSNCNRNDYYWQRTTPSPSSEEIIIKNKCLEGEDLIAMLMRGIYGLLIVLCVLELCVVISVVVMGIKALKSRNKETYKSTDVKELFDPLLEDDTKSAA